MKGGSVQKLIKLNSVLGNADFFLYGDWILKSTQFKT